MFRNRRIDLHPQADGVCVAKSELLPLLAIAESNIGDPKSRRYIGGVAGARFAFDMFNLSETFTEPFELWLGA